MVDPEFTDRRRWQDVFGKPPSGIVIAGAWLFFAPFAVLFVSVVSRLHDRSISSMIPVFILGIGTTLGGALLVRTTLRSLARRARGNRRAA